jgi:hypothetical protein
VVETEGVAQGGRIGRASAMPVQSVRFVEVAVGTFERQSVVPNLRYLVAVIDCKTAPVGFESPATTALTGRM